MNYWRKALYNILSKEDLLDELDFQEFSKEITEKRLKVAIRSEEIIDLNYALSRQIETKGMIEGILIDK